MQYKPTEPPTLFAADPGLEHLRTWLFNELTRISNELQNVKQITFVRYAALPARFKDGDLYYFEAGVAGASEGLYQYAGGSWQVL